MKGLMSGAAKISAIGALALLLSAAPAAAQQSSDASCRCVDDDGNEIEQCSCFRMPSLDNVFDNVFEFSFNQESRPRLGISVDASQSARRDGIGAMVTDVLDRGPADEAGIRTGDYITEIDGQSLFEPIDSDAEEAFDLDQSVPVQRLLAIARELEPGQQVEVAYIRDDEEFTTTVEAEELSDSWGRNSMSAPYVFDQDRLRSQLRGMRDRNDEWRVRSREMSEQAREMAERQREEMAEMRERYRDQSFFVPRAPRAPDADVRVFGGDGASGLVLRTLGGARYGLELVELNPSLGAYFGTDEGVLVADVDEDSELGLQPGDVVVAIGDRDVTTPNRLIRVLGSYDDDEDITLTILRDGQETEITGRTGG